MPEESLKESLVAHRDSSPLAGVRDAKIISLAGSQVCHSKHCEESLLSAKDSLKESPERQLLCHSEGARSATEESLKESLVVHSNSSVGLVPSLVMTTG